MPDRFEIYIVYKRRYINNLPFLYLLASTDDLIRFCWSKVKVTAGHQGGEVIHIDAGTSLMLERPCLSSS